MPTTTGLSRVEVRRSHARELILSSAWELAGRAGLDALSLREIGAAVGMRAPSLYSYFPGKAAILDALFADGFQALDTRIAAAAEALPPGASPRERLVGLLETWMAFCQEDRARYQLMFTAAVPGWSPSAEAYAASVVNYSRLVDDLALAAVTDPGDVDLCTALSAGLVAQQMANDPDGDRWVRRIPEVVDMLLAHVGSRDEPAASGRRARR
jgi:AcrR family transcriptional regulator